MRFCCLNTDCEQIPELALYLLTLYKEIVTKMCTEVNKKIRIPSCFMIL